MRLIDADTLRIATQKPCTTCKVQPHFCSDCPVTSFLDIIGNAPTIEPDNEKYLEERDADAFETGFIKGVCEGTPKGKWISGNNGFLVCSCCNELSDWKYPFCQWCGANMKGGAE